VTSNPDFKVISKMVQDRAGYNGVAYQ